MTCRRNFSKEQIIAGLKNGRTLCIDRKDAPELEDLLELQKEGLVTSTLVIVSEQLTVWKFKWKA
jgi:hypothetical protein